MSLAIAKTRQAAELRILNDRRADVVHNLETGGVSAGGMQRPKEATKQLEAYIKELDKQIKELSKLDDKALMAKYTPEIPEEVKDQIRGTNFASTLARGVYY